MSIFFPTRTKVEQLPPQHRDLTLQRRLGVLQSADDWERLLASVARHDEVTGGRAKYALPTEFYERGLPVLRVLLADAAPGAPVGLSVLEANPQFGPDQPVPDRGRRRGTKEAYATLVTLMAEAPLRDGSHVRLTQVTVSRRRKWRQSNGRKTKFKNKTKHTYRLEALLTLPKGVEPRQPAVAPPADLQVRVFPGKRARVRVRAKATEAPAGDQILDLMTEAFRWAPSSRLQEAS